MTSEIRNDLSPPALSPEERRLCRIAAWRLIPLLGLAYFFNYLDRTSVGYAALQMRDQLGLTAFQFGLGAGIMFFGYCLCEVPSNLAMYRYGARVWLARIMISWGLVATLMAVVVGPWSFYTLRLLLGIAEAGFFPGVIFYLSLWFPPQFRTRVLAWFTIATPVSFLVGGPLSTSLLQMHGLAGLAGWQWMFVIEGLPAIVLGLFTLRWLAAIPYFFSTLGLIFWARAVDRGGRAGVHLIAALLLAAMALMVSLYLTSLVPALIGIMVALVGTISAKTIFFTLPGTFLRGQAAAGGIALINSIGAFGGFAGPFMMGIAREMTDSFTAGMMLMGGVILFAAGLALVLLLFMRQRESQLATAQ